MQYPNSLEKISHGAIQVLYPTLLLYLTQGSKVYDS